MRISRKIYFIALFSATFINAFGQDENKEAAQQIVEIANEAYFNLRVILIANEQYAQAAEMDPDNIEANYMAGRTFLETNSKASASKYLLRVYEINPNYKYNILYLIGQGFQYGLEFEKAMDYYNQYLEKVIQSPRRNGEDFTSPQEVQRRIYECRNGIEFVNAPRDYTIENAGPAINSEWDDFAPVVTADEAFMAFTTRRQDGNTNMDVFDDMLYYEDVFYSARSGDKWTPAQNIGPPINIIYHSSNLAISADGSQLYLYKSQNGGDIFLSEKNSSGTWSEPEPLNENINSTFSENSVSISPDGNTLYFSSDRPVTADKTDLDIYYSKKDRKGKWGVAKNIGPVINTEFDEDGPFIDYDGKTLYFSSKGHKGMGGYDIYKSVYNEGSDEWSEPVNLGYPMNSPDNDVYFVSTRDGKTGYYASARADGLGFTDIYHIRLADLDAPPKKVEAKKIEPPEPEEPIEPVVEIPKPIVLVLKTVDKQTRETLEVDISISSAVNSHSVPVQRIGSGLYQAQFMNESSSQYNITVQKSGYMYKNVSVSIPRMTTKNNRIAKQIMLDKIKVGYSQVIRNIYFDFGTARLKSTSNPELNKLLKVLEENPGYIIEMSGHTDNVGGKDFNLWLSKRRAQAIVSYMVKKGQSEGRFLTEGYGEAQPLASNDDEELGRELNRRVEFKVLRFKQ
ncbi:MAG: PD40 domain-containing protein [Cyclobacteriaceae bacterium]|nr:PD40 domain-containing protein [Cyclobacteriaceae bacterium]